MTFNTVIIPPRPCHTRYYWWRKKTLTRKLKLTRIRDFTYRNGYSLAACVFPPWLLEDALNILILRCPLLPLICTSTGITLVVVAATDLKSLLLDSGLCSRVVSDNDCTIGQKCFGPCEDSPGVRRLSFSWSKKCPDCDNVCSCSCPLEKGEKCLSSWPF